MTSEQYTALTEAWMPFIANGSISAADAIDMVERGESPATANRPADEVDPHGVVLTIADALGRKFDVADIIDGGAQGNFLYETAEAWLPTQTGARFDWLRELAVKYTRGGGLTDRQAAGVLNCLVRATRDAKIAAARPVIDTDDAAYDAWMRHVEVTHARESAQPQVETASTEVPQGFYTVVFPEKGDARTTIKVGQWRDDNRRPGQKIRWIGYLTGPQNTSDYTTFAMQFSDGGYRFLPKYREGLGVQKSALRVVLDGTDAERNAATTEYAVESGNCARCGRVLTVPGWEGRMGLGPECYRKVMGEV